MRTTMNARGFSMVELILVSSIICILCAILIPKLLGSLVRAREVAAEANMHALDVAQAEYKATTGNVAPDLTTLATAGLMPQDMSSPSWVPQGYLFTMVGVGADANGNPTSFEMNAYPQNPTPGAKSFCMGGDHVLRYSTANNGAPIGTAAGACESLATIPGVQGPVSN